MKLHRNTAEAIVSVLQSVFNEQQHAEITVKKTLKSNHKWGSRDRRLIAQTIYDIIRWRLFIAHVASNHGHDPWQLLGAWCIWKDVDIPHWEEFKNTNTDAIKSKLQEKYPLHIQESIPPWMDQLGHHELGDRWSKELQALNKKAAVALRVNTLKGSVESMQRQLAKENIETMTVDGADSALMLLLHQNITRSKIFQKGYMEMQDISSQQVAPLLRVAPHMCVIDACAGAGGKTLHLAALMKNKGKIIALDTEERKLNELDKRVQRAGVRIVNTELIKSKETINQFKNTADRLLLDVPCSGIGTLRRHPDLKWKLSLARIEEAKKKQKMILEKYVDMLKPEGLMVYATCSIFPSENEEQIHDFIAAKNGEFELIEEKNSWPSDGFDGFYMALLKKKDKFKL